jgi:ribosome-associated toxin RatA of RatAB toxin-antitoxin module
VNVRRSVLVPYPVESVFDVIEQAEHYPQFMPWCIGATILERSDDWVAGKVDFSFFEVRFSFVTRNPKRRPEWLRVRVVDGPFRRFDGDWQLTRLGDLGCRVDFEVAYEIADGLLDLAVRPIVDFVARAMIDAFVQRAENLHGEMP